MVRRLIKGNNGSAAIRTKCGDKILMLFVNIFNVGECCYATVCCV